ncbi:hypothetical protein [Rhizohabitans arisaemae]|uniref:hypothetical protein n=1 Tax=Rhizohabitans arisaemae TaxID=2720610 RepID=UPI0024B24656|nr:hypothetical protein [Rhizohabitans arisaemae]
MARKPTEPNRVLRALISEAGFSHKGLARRLNELGADRGVPGLRYDHSSVIRWLAGQHPREPVPQLLAELFELCLGRSVTPADVGMRTGAVVPNLGQEFPHTWQEGISTVTSLWRADVERRRFLVDSTFAVGAGATGIARWLTVPDGEKLASRGAGRQVGMGDVADIREVCRSFGELDNRFGGGRIRTTLAKYLDSSVSPLLRDGVYGDTVGRSLFSAAAELTKLAGWMAYDLEQHGLAQRYLIQALRLARASGDHGLGGEILAGMAHQAVYVGHPQHALDLARAAQFSARRAGIQSLLAESCVMEAQAHAALSDGTACATSLHEAEKAFDRRKPGEEPSWISYFGEAYLSAKFGHCFRELGDQANAVRHARRALDMDGRYVRGRMFNLALLASSHALGGQLDEACAVGAQALNLAGELQSARTKSYLADLRRRLDPFRGEPAVAALLDQGGRPAPR